MKYSCHPWLSFRGDFSNKSSHSRIDYGTILQTGTMWKGLWKKWRGLPPRPQRDSQLIHLPCGLGLVFTYSELCIILEHEDTEPGFCLFVCFELLLMYRAWK